MPVGPAVNVLPTRGGPNVGPVVNRLPPSPAYGGAGIPAYGANIRPYMTNQMGMKKGGSVKSASARADGCAVRGKTKGKIV